jgi:hypothetical protein
VCIHCRHAAGVAAREKRKRVMLRGGAVGIVVALFVTAGIVGATAMRGRSEAKRPPANVESRVVASSASKLATVSPVDSSSGAAAAGNPAPNSAGVNAPQSAAQPAPPFGPILPAGESPIGEGVTAVRTDSTVVVSFDSPMVRTRRPEKFESLVRATLPAIYGRGADSALAHVPEGGLMGQGDLIAVLPTRGIRIPAGDMWEIRVYPETRTGQDGPLVVRYRVSLVSSGA